MMNVRKQGNSYRVIEKETELVWRSFDNRKDAEAWADQADPQRRDR